MPVSRLEAEIADAIDAAVAGVRDRCLRSAGDSEDQQGPISMETRSARRSYHYDAGIIVAIAAGLQSEFQ
jgi:hypothetical protein